MSVHDPHSPLSLEARVAARLRDARLQSGLTQREAARRLDLPDHTRIVRYETGSAQPSLSMLAALARLYGLTPAALLAGEDLLVPLIAGLERAPPATQLAVAELLKS